MPQFSILTFNCFGAPFTEHRALRFRQIAKEIKKLDPDIVMLQEVIYRSDMRILLRELDGIYHFPTINFAAGYLNRNGGLLTISKHKFKAINFEGFTKQGVFPYGMIDSTINKGYLHAKIQINQELDLEVINTHLVRNYFETEAMREVQYKQLRQIHFYMKKIEGAIILGGDFNCRINTANYHTFMHLSKLVNPNTEPICTFDTQHSNFLSTFGREECSRIDYTLYNNFKPKSVVQTKVFTEPYVGRKIETFLSDHYGLYTVFEL
jgi:endonuclease/exonuclease/phosphatase family metal-dependent hydrolase